MPNPKSSGIPFRWVSPISERSFQNYVQRNPAPAANPSDELYQAVANGGRVAPSPEQFHRDMSRSVPAARMMLRNAADQSIQQYGLFDDRTKRLTSILESEENEDAYLRPLFPNGEVDEDRVKQHRIDRSVDEQLVQERLNRDQQNELDAMLKNNQGSSSMGVFRNEAETKSYFSPDKVTDADNRSQAVAHLNLFEKENPEIYKDSQKLYDRMDREKLPAQVKEQVLELAKSKQREDEANTYFEQRLTAPGATGTVDYYTADVAKLRYPRINGYIDGLNRELDQKVDAALEGYKAQLGEERKRMLATATSPFQVVEINKGYNEAVKNARKSFEQQRNTLYQQHLPVNSDDVTAMQYYFKKDKLYDKTPQEAATYLDRYRARLLENKLKANPNLDCGLFEAIWQQTATEMAHTIEENGRQQPTLLGVRMAATAKSNLFNHLDVKTDRWGTAFGINEDGSSLAKEQTQLNQEMLDEGTVLPNMNFAQKVGLGAVDMMRHQARKLVGSIATFMTSDETNDERDAAIKEKLSRKLALTFDERQYLEANHYRDQVRELTGRNDPFYSGGEAAFTMVPYTLQFMAGNKAMSLAGFSGKLRPVFRAVKEGAPQIGKLARVLNVGRNLGTQLGQASAITAIFPQMGNMNTNRRMYADVSTMNGDGSFNLKVEKAGEFTSRLKGTTEALIDNYTEFLGEGFDRGFHYIGRGAGWGARKMGLGVALSRANKLADKAPLLKTVAGLTLRGSVAARDSKLVSKGVKEIMELGKRNGIMGEYLEEEASRNLGAVINGDNDGKVAYKDANGKVQFRDKTLFERLQFMDREFLANTGSSIALYTLTQNLALGLGNSAFGRKVSTTMPKYDENGEYLGTQKVKVSRKALGLIQELQKKNELTEENISTIADRFKGREGERIRSYGLSLVQQASEKQQVSDSHDDLISQGLTEEQVKAANSPMQAARMVESRELLNSGHATVDANGYVRVDTKRLDQDIASKEDELKRMQAEQASEEQMADVQLDLNNLKRMKKEHQDRFAKRITDQLPKDGTIEDYTDRMDALRQEMDDYHRKGVHTHDGDAAYQDKVQAYNVMYGMVRDHLNGQEEEYLTEQEQRLDLQTAIVNELEKSKEGKEGSDLIEHEKKITEEKKKLDSIGKAFEVIRDIYEQQQISKEESRTTEEREQALQEQQEQEEQVQVSDLNGMPATESPNGEAPTLEDKPVASEPNTSEPAAEQEKITPAPPKAIPQGPMLLHTMVSFDENGRVKGDKKKVRMMLEHTLDLPDDASLKVSFANGTVSATVSYKGYNRNYNLLRNTVNGLVEVDADDLRHEIAQSMQRINVQEQRKELLQEQLPLAQAVVSNPDMVLLRDMDDENTVRTFLNETLEPTEAAQLMASLLQSRKKNGQTLGQQLLDISIGLANGNTQLPKTHAVGLLKAMPKIADSYQRGMVEDADTKKLLEAEPINSDRRVRAATTFIVAQSGNESIGYGQVENSTTKAVIEELERTLSSKKAQLEKAANAIERLSTDEQSLSDIDATMGNRYDYEEWLLSHSGVKGEYSRSHSVYESIQRNPNGPLSYAQQATIQLFVKLGLLENNNEATDRHTANEVIHRGVLRLYAITIGTPTVPKEGMEQLKKLNRAINKHRSAASEIDNIIAAGRTLSKMVAEYNTCYTNGMQSEAEQSEIGARIVTIAADHIGRVEAQVKEWLTYLEDTKQYNIRRDIDEHNAGTPPRKPRAMDMSTAKEIVTAIATYAQTFNSEAPTPSPEINQKVAQLSRQLCGQLDAIRETLKEINSQRYAMVAGVSVESPSLKGETASECLDVIVKAKGDNAISALWIQRKLAGREVKLVRLSEEKFTELLNQHSLNASTTAAYISGVVYLHETAGNHEHALLHELTHALTVSAIEENGSLNEQLNVLFNSIKQELTSKGLVDEGIYGLTSPAEFLAEYFGNSGFARLVNTAGTPSTAIGRLVAALRQLIRKALGLPSAITIHDRVIFLADALSDRNELLTQSMLSSVEEPVRSVIYALEEQGTPAEQDAKKVFVRLMAKLDRMDSTLPGTLAYVKLEERMVKQLSEQPQMVLDSYKELGLPVPASASEAVASVLEALRGNSLFRYTITSYRIRQHRKSELARKRTYEASESGAAASAEERMAAQQKAFSPLVKNLAQLTGQTRDSAELQLIRAMNSPAANSAVVDADSYDAWVENLLGSASTFDRALGEALQDWDYRDFVSAHVFYTSIRNERHLKIMFDRDGNAIVDTVNGGAQLHLLMGQLNRKLNAFAATKIIFEFGGGDKRPVTYTGMDGMLKYAASVRASSRDDFAAKRTTRINEYQRELDILQQLSGIDSKHWDTLLSSEGFDGSKTVSLTIGGRSYYVPLKFRSYRDFCYSMEKLIERCRDIDNPVSVSEAEAILGTTIANADPTATVFANDRRSYFKGTSNESSKYIADALPYSVMTTSILTKLDRDTIAAKVKGGKAELELAAQALLQSLFAGNTNDSGQNVRSNIDRLASAVAAKEEIASSGFGVDNNRVSGMVLNSSLHHIADNITSVGIDNGLTRFYNSKGTSATPVVLNGMVDLSDRDHPMLFDEFNDVDYWRAQLVLFHQGRESYYASMGVFSDKGRGLFIEAPKYGLEWNEDGSFADLGNERQLFPDFDESLQYFLDKYAFKMLPGNMTSEEERRICTEFFVSFVRNIKDINEVFQGEGYKNLTDLVKRGAPVISPGYNPSSLVKDGLGALYSHMVISDIINTDDFGNEYELANGIQFATREWFDKLTNSVGEVYARTKDFGKLSSTKALTTGINRSNGQRFLTKTNIICIDEVAEQLGGRWALLRDFMREHEIDTVSSPSGTKKNSYIPAGTEHLQKNVGKPEKPKYDGAFNLFGLEQGSYTKDDVAQFVQPYATNDLFVQQDLRHDSASSWSKQSKQQRMNMTSIEQWDPIYESLINSQVKQRIATFGEVYQNATTEEEKKLVLANAIIDRKAFLKKPIKSMDELATAIENNKADLEDEDMEQLLAIMNPNAKLSYPSIARWVRTKLSSALQKGAIEVKVNRTATQELPDLNQEHRGYQIIDDISWSLMPFLREAGFADLHVQPSIALAEASTSDASRGKDGAMREQKRYQVLKGETVMDAFIVAIKDAIRYPDMYHLNDDGSLPDMPTHFNGTIPSMLKLHELRYEKDADGTEWVVVPGEPFVTNRVPGSSLVSHSVVRLKHALSPEVNYTMINVQAQLASGSDFDGDARYNQLMVRGRGGELKLDDSMAGINNRMVLVTAEAYSRPENYDRITRPLDVDYANPSVDAIRAKRISNTAPQDRYGMKGGYDTLDPIGYEDARIKNAAGVTMKAIMANLNSAFSYLKSSEVPMRSEALKKLKEKVVIYKEYNHNVYQSEVQERFTFGDPIADRYDIVKKVIENELNLAFDNAKDPKIEDQGITEVTANLFVFMMATSGKLKEMEGKLNTFMKENHPWGKKHELLDRFFKAAAIEADAVFNYLNSAPVQDYIRLSRSGTVGKYLSADDIKDKLYEQYSSVPGGVAKIDALMQLLEFSRDLSTIQASVNAPDSRMGTVADWMASATAISDILSGRLSYFDFTSKYGWDNLPSWLYEPMQAVKLHATVLYGDAIEYSSTYINAVNGAVAILQDGKKNSITKGMRAAIGDGVLQALSAMVVYPELSLQQVEQAVTDFMVKAKAKTKGNAFLDSMMLAGTFGRYQLSSLYTALHSKPTAEQVLLAKEGFRRITKNKTATISGKEYGIDQLLYLYQQLRYGGRSISGGYNDLIADETVAEYSARFMDRVGGLSQEALQRITVAAVTYGAYRGASRGKIATSTWGLILRSVGNANVKDGSFDPNVWANGRFTELVGDMISDREGTSLNRLSQRQLLQLENAGLERMGDDKLSEYLAEHGLSMLEDAINKEIEDSSSTTALTRAKVAIQLVRQQRQHGFPEEKLTKTELENVKIGSTIKSYPLGYMAEDSYTLNRHAVEGRVFTVKDMPGRFFAVTGVNVLNLSSVFSEQEIDGMTREQFMSRIAPQLIAGKVLYQTRYKSITPAEAETARLNGGRVENTHVIDPMENPRINEQHHGKLIYASPTSGKSFVADSYDRVVDMDRLIRDYVTDRGVKTDHMSNRDIELEFFKLLNGKSLKERQNLMLPIMRRVNEYKKAGYTILTGNAVFLEDRPYSQFEGKLKGWVNEFYLSDINDMQKRLRQRYNEEGIKTNKTPEELAAILSARERAAVGDRATQLYNGERLSDRLTRVEDGNLLEELKSIVNNAENLITLQELTDRVDAMVKSGRTTEEAIEAIARELNCR